MNPSDANPLVRSLEFETLSDAHHPLKRARFELQQHDGGWAAMSREVYERSDSTAALIFDRARRTVLLVRQFRLPAAMNGPR